jgi:hypothetical protein
MAVWQVQFAIVPRLALTSKQRVPLTQLMDNDWWSAANLPPGYTQKIAAIVPFGESLTPEHQMWGTEDGNRVDVWSEDGRATRMTAHVDVRRLDATFGAMVLQFARIADAVLIRSDGLVIEPQVGAFGAALRTSQAWSHASGPATIIASREEREDDDDG